MFGCAQGQQSGSKRIRALAGAQPNFFEASAAMWSKAFRERHADLSAAHCRHPSLSHVLFNLARSHLQSTSGPILEPQIVG